MAKVCAECVQSECMRRGTEMCSCACLHYSSKQASAVAGIADLPCLPHTMLVCHTQQCVAGQPGGQGQDSGGLQGQVGAS